MADTHRRPSGGGGSRRQQQQQQQPSRLQRRAPASLQINRSDWKVAIPLLSPLVSPSSPKEIQNSISSREGSASSLDLRHHQASEQEQPPVFQKWQHPAAPFHYDSGPRAPRFVPV